MRITIGNSRKDIHWRVTDISWSDLCHMLSNTERTPETLAEYRAMSKDTQSSVKDVGGFVGGVIVNGRRTKANVTSRTLVTLDADFATQNVVADMEVMFDYAMCCYSTHKHTARSPRLRFVIPLDREVTPEEYEPIARMLAKDIGINQFDITTYEVSRLMYWPSTSKDGEFVFKEYEGGFVSADDTLARYVNWHDATEWPTGDGESTVQIKEAKAQGEPKSKPGLVGLFCKAYDIPEAIETFLPDIYEPCIDPNRYTYMGGSTSAGAILYQDGQFIYSHHSTDPAGGKLCNAFDLVRLHKFSDMDAECSIDTPINKRPSYKAMCDFAQDDAEVKKYIIAENTERIKEAFSESVSTNWTERLRLTSKGAYEPTIENLSLILENDEHFKGCLAINEFTGRACIIADLPWRKCEDRVNGSAWSDTDDSSLRGYIESVYGIYNTAKVTDALMSVMQKHSYHPVRKYLNSLEWDGIQRGEKLFIHYLGAEDSLYTRTVTRKWLAAAVARVMVPGIKFDNLVVLVGSQGIGKSYLGNMLGRQWFSDTFSTVQGKDAYDQLKGNWIIEIGELSAMKKAEVESVKMFISKREDNYRAAYGRFAQVNKRQCVFYGTTNDDSFLRDRTGNRRFWPIGVDKEKALYDVFELDDETMDQIWAEATHWFKKGESLYLNAQVTALATEEQEKYMTVDPRQGMVEDFLDRPIPLNWYDLDKTARRNFIQGYTELNEGEETMLRNSVTVSELAYELFGEEVVQPFQAKEYHNMLTGISGWRKTGARKRSIYGQQYVYERVESNADN